MRSRGDNDLSGTNLTSERRTLRIALAAFLVVSTLAAVDVVTDLRSGTSPQHVLVEAGVFFLAAVGAGLVGRLLARTTHEARSARAAARSLEGRLADTTAEAARWQAEARSHLLGLGTAIDAQFDRWELSAAEREVAFLLLKGLSHKEVADVRSVSEATARQQARAVYRKAGLTGRHDLAAFFLEDLMVPIEARSPGGAPPPGTSAPTSPSTPATPRRP